MYLLCHFDGGTFLALTRIVQEITCDEIDKIRVIRFNAVGFFDHLSNPFALVLAISLAEKVNHATKKQQQNAEKSRITCKWGLLAVIRRNRRHDLQRKLFGPNCNGNPWSIKS